MWWFVSQNAHGLLLAMQRHAESGKTLDISQIVAAAPIMSVEGSVAQINVVGVLTQRPNFYFAHFYGNTTYADIQNAVAQADSNPAVKSIELMVDSPGGELDGLYDTVAALQSTTKKITATVNNQASSAAYAIAAQAQKITAKNEASRVGSIGVAASFFMFDGEIEIASTNAPKKRPDPRTEEGQVIIREELDALHNLFVGMISVGRGVDAEKINKDFGQGAEVLATEAKKLGMIDAIANKSLKLINKQKQGAQATMDIETLRTAHPAVYAAVIALGVEQERDRVVAHTTMGVTFNAQDIALKAIQDGTPMTAALQAQYLCSGANKKEQEAVADDDKNTQAAVGGVDQTPENAEAEAEKVTAYVESKLGIVGGAK